MVAGPFGDRCQELLYWEALFYHRVPYSRLEWPSQMLDWPALLGCLELADMADIGWVGKVPSF